jgi:ABC-2 type transport system ATP-binding protein
VSQTQVVTEAPAVDLTVTTRGLVRDYGGGAGLHGIDLAVPRTGVYGLVGPNGAGKTTLLSILAGLRRADAGEVLVNVTAGRIAVCPDTPEFEPWLTATEVVRQSYGLVFPARRGAAQGGPADPGRVAAVLAEVGLTDAAKRRVGGFSRGMTQRLGLAVALVLDPELLILDEPTSALDPAGRAELLALIARLADERTVIFSSHILADVERVADYIGVLDHGHLLFQGPTEDLINSQLQPAWEVRVRGSAAELAGLLGQTDWVASVQSISEGVLRVEGVSTGAVEEGLQGILAAAGVRLVSVMPVDADLETAFLALTSGGSSDERTRPDTQESGVDE